MHTHIHDHCCSHNFKYCSICDVVYCSICGKTWYYNTIYSPFFYTYTTDYYNTIYSPFFYTYTTDNAHLTVAQTSASSHSHQ